MRNNLKGKRAANLRLVALASIFIPTFVYAQTSDPTPPPATPSTDAGTAEFEAQKKLFDAQTAASNAATAAWNAKKAETEAKIAAEKAQFGVVQGQATLDGSIQAGNTPTKAEALLLVTKASVDAGQRIAQRITPFLNKHQGRDVVILTDRKDLAVTDAIIFDLKMAQLSDAGQASNARFANCPSPPRGQTSVANTRMAPLTAVGAGLELLTKFGSYFQSNYSYGQVDVELAPDLLAAAVVQAYDGWPQPPSFIVPSHSLVSDASEIIEGLRPLNNQYLEWIANREAALRNSEGYKDTDAVAFAACTAAAAEYQKAISYYDSFIGGLSAEVTGGEPVGVRVIRQKQLQKLLAQKPLVLLITGQPAAAYYTKKNLWTFLGGMPIYTMGGTSTTYTLFEPPAGRILTRGALAHHGGYRALNRVERLVNTSAANGETHARR